MFVTAHHKLHKFCRSVPLLLKEEVTTERIKKDSSVHLAFLCFNCFVIREQEDILVLNLILQPH